MFELLCEWVYAGVECAACAELAGVEVTVMVEGKEGEDNVNERLKAIIQYFHKST